MEMCWENRRSYFLPGIFHSCSENRQQNHLFRLLPSFIMFYAKRQQMPKKDGKIVEDGNSKQRRTLFLHHLPPHPVVLGTTFSILRTVFIPVGSRSD